MWNTFSWTSLTMTKHLDEDGVWLIISRAVDLQGPRPLVPIELDNKQYVLFRDDEGYLGLIGRNCPHRGADLFYGRLENNGLRCPFHGWHFDRTGQCIGQPAEPEDSIMSTQIKIPVIPVTEKAGIIYALVPKK